MFKRKILDEYCARLSLRTFVPFRKSAGIKKVSAETESSIWFRPRKRFQLMIYILSFFSSHAELVTALLAVINWWKSSQKRRAQNKSQFDYLVNCCGKFPHTFNRKTLLSAVIRWGRQGLSLEMLDAMGDIDEGTLAICVIAPRKPVELAYKRIKYFLCARMKFTARRSKFHPKDRKRFLPRFLRASLPIVWSLRLFLV